MHVEFKSEQPVTDASCKRSTGKTLKEWYSVLDDRGALKRRDAINWLYEQANKDAWWSTTIWVEYERSKGIVNKKDGLVEGYNICVTKTVAAPLAKVYAAFADQAQLRKWFGDQVAAKVAEQETFSDAAGNRGTYLRVRHDKDLRFTWKGKQSPAESLVDIAFAAKGADKTGITLTHNRIQNRDEADGLRAAWGAAFDRLKAALE